MAAISSEVAALIEECKIGTHTSKLKSLTETVKNLPDKTKPYQIFLGNPQSVALSCKEEDMDACAALMKETGANVYVHSQYIINLSAEPDDKDALSNLLGKNLQIAKRAGLKGVVVHVGKAVKRDKKVAVENMRQNLLRALEHATPKCPILLETPAGQGTETLQTYEEFVEFADSFQSESLRVCVDTCHVFACGHKPDEYITKLTTEKPGLLKLVHFNDSREPCGSKKDRHAFIGSGHIGFKTMSEIAHDCKDCRYPMVIE